MLGRLWSIYFVVAHFTNARTTGFPATCSSDWSVDRREHVVRCPNVESETPIKCAPSTCSDFPTCSSCVNVASQERRDRMTCQKGYNVIDTGSSSFTMCIDEDESAFECTGGCEGTLTCDSCAFDVNPFHMQQLQKRANPMVNGMVGGAPGRGGFGPSGLDW
ncbi:hypothetical protein PGT21_027571 [Puccinia graminis f. sp. tritici]|uniref:Uncharacterized protein n=2 Tax=Puccinia graminis f. sp. tritici TaxID=56615 RepID=E3KGK6_PUCGT|nr:uncharacterized protein PGTG_08617 [Puccinia graminis f. sp. tritici CRL 75-36-700-3]EFP83431.2 hypothetical protein PGTG_08617 [Puccinia graminis f. sp. tritici CRL 75-36-700-3]KAA1072089.1 hypothetical protein PGT21_027571 [Puccinia graminis f. sp. tritici]KAA1113896.1 hypothetical protein PGTUg99_012680 [Puccinia graminis f. sp. tritici]